MPEIKLVMSWKDRVADHVVGPTFVRESGGFLSSSINWDTIHNWVANGYTVSIRPATDEEKIAAKT